MIHKLLFAICVLCGSFCPAQTTAPNLLGPWRSTLLVEGGRIDAVASLGGGVVICGTRRPHAGHIFRSNDDGITWTDLGQVTKQSFTCVAAGKGESAYALTDGSEFWVS